MKITTQKECKHGMKVRAKIKFLGNMPIEIEGTIHKEGRWPSFIANLSEHKFPVRFPDPFYMGGVDWGLDVIEEFSPLPVWVRKFYTIKDNELFIDNDIKKVLTDRENEVYDKLSGDLIHFIKWITDKLTRDRSDKFEGVHKMVEQAIAKKFGLEEDCEPQN